VPPDFSSSLPQWHNNLPAYHDVPPAGVLAHYGVGLLKAQSRRHEPAMFHSFLDGTNPSIAWRRSPMPPASTCRHGGLLFPPAASTTCRCDAAAARPRRAGEIRRGGSGCRPLERDGLPLFAICVGGVYVVAGRRRRDYAADCSCKRLHTDASGRYAAMYKPYHLIGLELNISC